MTRAEITLFQNQASPMVGRILRSLQCFLGINFLVVVLHRLLKLLWDKVPPGTQIFRREDQPLCQLQVHFLAKHMHHPLYHHMPLHQLLLVPPPLCKQAKSVPLWGPEEYRSLRISPTQDPAALHVQASLLTMVSKLYNQFSIGECPS